MYDYWTLDGLNLHDIAGGTVMCSEIEGLTGVPPIRAGDAQNRPEGDGQLEPRNAYLNARMVRGKIHVFGTSIAQAWDNFSAVQLVVLGAVRQSKPMTFRPQGHATADLKSTGRVVDVSPPVLTNTKHGPYYEFEVVIRCADPINYSQASFVAFAPAPGASTSGMPLPIKFPISFGLTSTGGDVSIRAGGDAATWPVVTVTGPIVDPVIRNVTQDKTLTFDGLTLLSGEELVIDMAARTAFVGASDKIGLLRYTDSSFFNLNPGVLETIQFYGLGLGYSGVTAMQVAWNNAYVA